MVNVDFDGTLNGEAFSGAAQDHSVELGVGRMLKDFEDGFGWHGCWRRKTIDVAFPDAYHAENLKVKRRNLAIIAACAEGIAEVNEDFIQKFGVEGSSVESFRAEVKRTCSANWITS